MNDKENSLLKTLGIKLMEKQFILTLWQIKNDTLTGNFGFVGNKMAFTIGKLTEIKSHLIIYKSNENTTD